MLIQKQLMDSVQHVNNIQKKRAVCCALRFIKQIFGGKRPCQVHVGKKRAKINRGPGLNTVGERRGSRDVKRCQRARRGVEGRKTRRKVKRESTETGDRGRERGN